MNIFDEAKKESWNEYGGPIPRQKSTGDLNLKMKSFCLNGYSGRHERWGQDGHRWVAAEPSTKGFNLWGYQDDTSEVVYLGGDVREEQIEKLAEQFLFSEPERIITRLFSKDAWTGP
ncbi:MAG TPA: hypothetical protein VE860_28190 [Chthoniobacterales bacterium]|nr:hypothetical protein [Chthoniobacterales bacterium]